ncbi:MAG: glutamine-synthetase adenylyltransferase, partial [Burkholderiaceae bacterium]
MRASADHSRFVQRVRRRYADDLAAWTDAPSELDGRSIAALVSTLMSQGRALPSALRVARHLVIERLAVLDIEHEAPLETVTRAMTELAEVALEWALASARAEEGRRHGQPLTETGQPIELWVVGMGKLGSRELNVSSDIDLVYVYEEDGTTDGADPITAHEFFGKVVKRIYSLIGDVTEDGFVFRVDLALRPNGNSGPPVVSLSMLEDYLHVQGREWERLAWLKSRVVAPRAAVSSGRAQALGAAITPFVYRKYLDYGVFEGLRQLHRKIREEAHRRAAGRPNRAHDVKLSRGGIREIEFIVQLLQVVRGGQFPELRTRPTLDALQRLTQAGLMPQD